MSDPFNGRWKLNPALSKVWDRAAGRWVPDDIGREDLSFTIDGDIHEYENVVGLNPTYRMGYTARYSEKTWVPYILRTVDGDAPPAPGMTVGEPFAYVMLVKIDENFHYRISKKPDGSPGYVMPRQMAPDGQSFVTSVYEADGTVTMIKVFDRA
jgi:hypothetical protein